MSPAVYPTIKIYIDNNDDDIAETDISALVCSAITGSHGNFGQKDADLIASPGNIVFEIENKTLAYNGATLIGKAVSLKLTYATREKQIFYGHISAATDDDSGYVLPLHIRITVHDWLHTANGTRLAGLSLTTFKRANEALELLMDSMTNAPAREDFDVGAEVFANMFDGSGSKAKVFSEMNKITNSEPGRLYLKFRPDGTGEVLRFESRDARGSLVPLSRIPTSATTAGLLKYHGNAGASGYLKYHGNAGASGKIKIHEGQDAIFDKSHFKADWQSGASLLNDFTVTNVFRNTDTSDVILYELQYPIPIGTTENLILNGGYSDPNGGTVIQAFDVSLNLADLEFWTYADGSGIDQGAYIQTITRLYPNRWEVEIFNTFDPGFLTQLIIRGKGIYKYNPGQLILENLESKTKLRAEYTDNLTREYSNDLTTSRMFANSVIALRRLPSRDLLSVSYHANDDEALLMGFMYLEQGDKINIVEIFPVHDGDFYIQGVKFKIELDSMIDFTWYVREETETMSTPIAVTAPVDASAEINAIDFGILPYLSNMPEFSISFWIRRNTATAPYFDVIGKSVDNGAGRRGWEVLVANDDNKIYFYSYKTPTDGEWCTTGAVLSSEDVWYSVGVSYINTSDKADPVIYVNGTAVAVTENITPSGKSDDDSDCPFILFNAGPDPAVPSIPYANPAAGFSLKDVRIYNRILTPAEFATIAATEDDYTTVPTGKIFNGIFAPTDNISDYIGDEIEDDDLVLDSVRGVGGTPYNNDPDTAATMLTGEAI